MSDESKNSPRIRQNLEDIRRRREKLMAQEGMVRKKNPVASSTSTSIEKRSLTPVIDTTSVTTYQRSDEPQPAVNPTTTAAINAFSHKAVLYTLGGMISIIVGLLIFLYNDRDDQLKKDIDAVKTQIEELRNTISHHSSQLNSKVDTINHRVDSLYLNIQNAKHSNQSDIIKQEKLP